MKPKLLVIELWGLGDLAIGSGFLAQTKDRFDVLLVAKPHAREIANALFPFVKVLPFTAPWTKFQGKYRLYDWQWRKLFKCIRDIRNFAPDIAISARRDPRDHAFLALSGARRRIGFPRAGSHFLLTDCLDRVEENAPRIAQWDALKAPLGLTPLPKAREKTSPLKRHVAIHTGAAQKLRVWPLDRYLKLIAHLESKGWKIDLIADPHQQILWKTLGRSPFIPATPSALIESLRAASVFIGNDSGPGHLAAALGKATFTIFGPQRPEWFLPRHSQSGWIEGKACPHKPCFDSCRYSAPFCLLENSADEVITKVQQWISTLDLD